MHSPLRPSDIPHLLHTLPLHTLAPDVSTVTSAGWTSEDRFLPKEDQKSGLRARVQQVTRACSARSPPPGGHWRLPRQAQRWPQVPLNTAPGGCYPVPRPGFRCDPAFQPRAQGKGRRRLHHLEAHNPPSPAFSAILWTQSALLSEPLLSKALDLTEDAFPALGPF